MALVDLFLSECEYARYSHPHPQHPQPAFADLAEKMIAHAGLSHRITVLTGTLEDVLKQEPLRSLPPVDAVFIDHDKRHYVPDLKLLIASNKLNHGAVVVADNLFIPGLFIPGGGLHAGGWACIWWT